MTNPNSIADRVEKIKPDSPTALLHRPSKGQKKTCRTSHGARHGNLRRSGAGSGSQTADRELTSIIKHGFAWYCISLPKSWFEVGGKWLSGRFPWIGGIFVCGDNGWYFRGQSTAAPLRLPHRKHSEFITDGSYGLDSTCRQKIARSAVRRINGWSRHSL